MAKPSRIIVLSTLIILCWCCIAAAGALPDTGQTKCYNDTAEITCPTPGEDFYGQDAQYVTNPRSYTKLDAGGNDLPDSATDWAMVRDNVTGLIWEVKTDDGSVHDKDDKYTWDDAQSVFIAEMNSLNFGGYSNWRLPSVTELGSILNLGRYSPAINVEYFSSTISSHYYWSLSASNAINAWGIQFNSGGHNINWKQDSYYVRAVRSNPSGSYNNLILNGNGTVTDTETGLMWQQSDSGSTMTWKEALAYCENLSLADYNDWRLPNRQELCSIVDYEKMDPAINADYFPSTQSSNYWSSTTHSTYTSLARTIEFFYGYDNSHTTG